LSNKFIWFKKWVLQRRTIAELSAESNYSVRSLKSLFDTYLQQAPTHKFFPSEQLNLLIDGTYFSNNICLIIYRDNTIKFTQLYRITDGEYYEEIKEDLQNLLAVGIQIDSITCDGHKSILKAVKAVCKQVYLQRCTVHIQRECRTWLTMNPKSIAGLELLSIVHQIHTITTHEQSHDWIKQVLDWHLKYSSFINEKSYSVATNRYWYKHKMVRKAFIHIRNAIPNLFTYLFNPRIPKTTNGLESFFGHLKSHVLIHRGLTKQHRTNFIKWYLYFTNQR
jgi:hypothetical protein